MTIVMGPIYQQLDGADLALMVYCAEFGLESPVTGADVNDMIVYVCEFDEEAGTLGTAVEVTPTVSEVDATNMPGLYVLKIANADLPITQVQWTLRVEHDGSDVSEFETTVYTIYFREMLWSALKPVVERIQRLSEAMSRKMGVS